MRPFDGSIEQLVPHRRSMLLIDRLLEDDADSVRVEARVKWDGLFLEEEGLPAWVGVELMAQAVATWVGRRRQATGEPPRLGFLLGTRRYECQRAHFPRGARLEIRARQELVSDEGLAVFSCEIHLDGQVVATANLNAFQPRDVQRYLESQAP